jgi:hypothetical protein
VSSGNWQRAKPHKLKLVGQTLGVWEVLREQPALGSSRFWCRCTQCGEERSLNGPDLKARPPVCRLDPRARQRRRVPEP